MKKGQSSSTHENNFHVDDHEWPTLGPAKPSRTMLTGSQTYNWHIYTYNCHYETWVYADSEYEAIQSLCRLYSRLWSDNPHETWCEKDCKTIHPRREKTVSSIPSKNVEFTIVFFGAFTDCPSVDELKNSLQTNPPREITPVDHGSGFCIALNG